MFLKWRLSDQAQSQIDKGSTKFEDICLGESRPSALVRRYNDLFSEQRLEALDALDQLDDLASSEDLKEKILFSIVVVSNVLASINRPLILLPRAESQILITFC